MTNEQILKRAIEKATSNGYTPGNVKDRWYYEVIFNHDFAKAFWGSGEIVKKFVDSRGIRMIEYRFDNQTHFNFERWQYHLQQLVLEEEPLKYLEKFL